MALQELDNLQLLPSFPLIPPRFPAGALGHVSPWLGQGNIQDYLAFNPEADRFSKVFPNALSVVLAELAHLEIRYIPLLIS